MICLRPVVVAKRRRRSSSSSNNSSHSRHAIQKDQGGVVLHIVDADKHGSVQHYWSMIIVVGGLSYGWVQLPHDDGQLASKADSD